MGFAFHQLCPRYSGTLTPTAPMAIRLWETLTFLLHFIIFSSPMDHSHLAHIVPPPPDIQPVVDRMAMYVAKNGVEFEIVVKSKNDARFEFLHPHHVHFAYYDFKKQLFIKVNKHQRNRQQNLHLQN